MGKKNPFAAKAGKRNSALSPDAANLANTCSKMLTSQMDFTDAQFVNAKNGDIDAEVEKMRISRLFCYSRI